MKAFPVFDAHCDTALELWERQASLRQTSGQWDLARAAQLPGWAQFFAFCPICSPFAAELGAEAVLARAYAQFLQQLEACQLPVCRDAAEVERQLPTGAVLLSLEGAEGIGCDPGRLEPLRLQGFAMTGLTWNYENEYACGAAADQAKGLTARGKEMVKVLTDQGIVMDISHLSDQGVEDLFQLTDRPVMASHSDIREVWDAPRNLQKVHLKELISRKGIIGMNFFAPFVGEKPQISDLLKHMDAVLEMGGEDCLAIGSDFDGCDGLFPAHIEGVQSMPFLREELLKHGFTEELTEKIFYKNAHRFVMENVK